MSKKTLKQFRDESGRAMSRELKQARADRDYWQGFIKSKHWRLSGWTHRNSALFVHDSGGCVDVTAAHLDLLGVAPAKAD